MRVFSLKAFSNVFSEDWLKCLFMNNQIFELPPRYCSRLQATKQTKFVCQLTKRRWKIHNFIWSPFWRRLSQISCGHLPNRIMQKDRIIKTIFWRKENPGLNITNIGDKDFVLSFNLNWHEISHKREIELFLRDFINKLIW